MSLFRKQRLFVSCQELNSQVIVQKQKESSLPAWTPFTKIADHSGIQKIVTNELQENIFTNCLIWKGKNRLEMYRRYNEIKVFTLVNEEIKDIQSSCNCYLILAKSGNLYSLANYSRFAFNEIIPLKDPEKSTLDVIRPIPFFNNDKKRKVRSIAMLQSLVYYLCWDGRLYRNGYNNYVDRGKVLESTISRIKKHQNLPILIQKNVSRIFHGKQDILYYTTNDNKLFSYGEFKFSKHFHRSIYYGNSPKLIPNWKANDIVDICCSDHHSILLNNRCQVYSLGNRRYSGIDEDHSVFTEIPSFQNKKIVKIMGMQIKTLALTEDNKLYGWGFHFGNHPNSRETLNSENDYSKPQEIYPPKCFQENSIPINFSSGRTVLFIYPKYDTIQSLKDDFKYLFESKKYCDSKLLLYNGKKDEKKKKKEIPIHKLIIELRTGLKIKKIEKIFQSNNFSRKEINGFLKWIYLDQLTINTKEKNKLEKIFNSLNLSFPNKTQEEKCLKNSLEWDLQKLYNDEESKDFFILTKFKKKKNSRKKQLEENEIKKEFGKKEKKKKWMLNMMNKNKKSNRKKKTKRKKKKKTDSNNTDNKNNKNKNKIKKKTSNNQSNVDKKKDGNSNIEEKQNHRRKNKIKKSKKKMRFRLKKTRKKEKGQKKNTGNHEKETRIIKKDNINNKNKINKQKNEKNHHNTETNKYEIINEKMQKEEQYQDDVDSTYSYPSSSDDDDEYVKIPIHKLILIARSRLFRDMFDNLNEKEKNINQIKDYTGKSYESLQILIKYFYTNTIELPSDNNYYDTELIKDELHDTIEYYQLNINSNFIEELNNL
ncbi:hypothetical protein M0813_16343 [Anaeramoeba flamelloides]|uniref:BTB domain-containing protein n=1 Tax=Anaeramoeba flamelloides TaxID=1746091 RepID=A0ABQ8YZM1_9EUKA|nr:hypothetical protein M0813_16343 [Anaeramoeba flamelloides]